MALTYLQVKAIVDGAFAETSGKLVGFDAAFYSARYADQLAGTTGDPLQFYVETGAMRGHVPNAWFDPVYYSAQYPDLVTAGLTGADLLAHYLEFGIDEGRIPSGGLAGFDGARYLTENPDVEAYVVANKEQFGADETGGVVTEGVMRNGALAHYLKFGAGEGRAAYTVTGEMVALTQFPAQAPIDVDADGVLHLNTHHGATDLVKGDDAAGTSAGGEVLHVVGDAAIRVDMTNPANQVRGIDLDGDGTIEANGVENNVNGAGVFNASNFEIFDAYARNPLNEGDSANNFLGNIRYDGTGFDGDGVSTDGNIVLGGLGADDLLAGIGNDFLAGGGVARYVGAGLPTSLSPTMLLDDVTLVVGDFLSGGRNADFMYGEFASLDNVDGVLTFFDGGTTADDISAGNGDSPQDSDWLLPEISDDEEYGEIVLQMGADQSSEDPAAGPHEFGFDLPVGFFGGDGYVSIGDGKRLRGILDDIENVDASGNLYGFLNGFDVELGGRRLDDRDGAGAENYGLGSSGQLRIFGSDSSNILIAGYDNDFVAAGDGNDLLFGGNMQFFSETVADGVTNPNLPLIVNDGRDELIGGGGDDDIVFEADGGIYEGGATYEADDTFDSFDTLWLTNYLFGTRDAQTQTTDGVVRFDLLAGQEPGLDLAAGYGGADENAATGLYTADQTNYSSGVARTQVQDMGSVDASGLGAIDFLAAGTNDPELNFSNQQNFWGYQGDLDLRGTLGDNGLYANIGDDVLEGRWGDDDLMGGQGNDDFYFAIDGDLHGDNVDIIRRKVDANNDGLWDTDEAGDVVWGPDFGLDQDVTTGASVLTIDIVKAGGNAPGDELDDVVNFVSQITTGVQDGTTFTPIVMNSAAIQAATTYAGLTAAINDALDTTAFGADLEATLQSDGHTILISDSLGRELADTTAEVPGAGVSVSQKANTATANIFSFGPAPTTVAEDRLIYKSYEDRADNEGVDDDSVTGSQITLGSDGYAEDLVVGFSQDGTRLAEDQSYSLVFTNLTTEDTVTVTVNGVTYQLTVGVDVNGTQVDAEDGVGDTQADIQAAFLERFADFIDSFMDDDTAAGFVNATYNGDGTTILLSQVAYDGEETVFMDRPTVTLTNASGGEPATVTVSNGSESEVHLFEFDGHDNALNRDNVLFWGETQANRSILETAENAGQDLTGSDALVINGGTVDDLAGIAHNLATDDELFTDADDDGVADTIEVAAGNFVVHGDDNLIGGTGDDTISGATGDDRVRGSLGNDTLDGGGDWYFVRRVGETKGTATALNAYEAKQLDADGDVLDIYLLEQTESADDMVAGANFMPYFRDTLIYEQRDFEPGVSRFTITLNDYSGTGDDIEFDHGGAGTVGVDVDGNGTVEADNVSTFTNFENIRTVSGVGLAVAGPNGGQGRDTLDVAALSSDAEVGVYYDLTGDMGAGNVSLIEDPDNDPDTANNVLRQVIKIDGPENVIFGSGDDMLDIDETEAAKDNVIQGGSGTDVVNYLNDFGSPDDEPTITVFVESASNTDTVQSTQGRVGTVVATDTLVSVEEITLDGNTAAGIREDDTINVESLAAGSTVDYVNEEIRNEDGDVMLVIHNMFEMENVVADGEDTVIVADGDVMSQNARADSWDERDDIVINTYLNYDLLDQRGTTPERLTVSDLRAIPSGTDDTADTGDLPEVRNFSLFNFMLGQDSDRVDYSNETGTIAAVVNFNEADDTQYVMVDHNASQMHGGNGGYRGSDDRIDRLVGVEQVVASQGESILDLTNSTRPLAVSFSREITPDGGRDVHRVQLSDLETDTVISRNYLEYRDNELDDDGNGSNAVTATDPADVFALWNTIEDSDLDSRVEFTDAETGGLGAPAGAFANAYYGRGGLNEANYNELTRSILLELNVIDYDPTDPSGSGLITGDVTFTDGATFLIGDPAHFIGDQDYIESYSAQNAIAAGALRVEASQDAEDAIAFDPALDVDKLFILGEVISGSDQITVKIGSGDAENSIELTGFEALVDSAQNDVYDMRDLERVQDNLTLVDNATDDRDTIKVADDAIAYDGGPAELTAPADTISLEVLNDVFGFDFDVLDVTAVEENNLLIVGDDDDQDGDATLNAADTDYIGPGDIDNDGDNDNSPRDTTTVPVDGKADDVIVGDLDLIDSITGFQDIWLTNASIASNGDEYVLDITAGELKDGAAALFTTDSQGLDFSLVDTSGVTVSVRDVAVAGASIVGSSMADTITGGAGNDTLAGGGGNDTLDGGIATEVRTVELAGILSGTAEVPAVTMTLGSGGFAVILNESAAPVDVDPSDGTLDILAGSGGDAVGAALATLVNANLADINAVADAFDTGVAGAADDVPLLSAAYDNGSNLLTFTFASGANVEVGDAIAVVSTDVGGTFAASTDTTIGDGGNGGADTFAFAATGASNGTDTINGFTATDLLDFSAFFDLNGASGGFTTGINFGAGFTSFGANQVAIGFNKETLAPGDFNGTGDFLNIVDGVEMVFLTTPDADGAVDATNDGWSAYYVYDSDPTGTVTVAVEQVGSINTNVELVIAAGQVLA